MIFSYLQIRLELIEESIKKQNYLNDPQPIPLKINESEKCQSILNKSNLVKLFYILMDEGILFFDSTDKVKSRSKMQKFTTNYFMYCGDQTKQVNMISVSKQFSECKGYIYKEKQLVFLNEILHITEKRKERLMHW